MRPDVVIVPCGSYDRAECRRALTEALTPLGWPEMIGPGMKVAIKANLMAPKKPETAALTHPALVAELCAMLRELGADPVVGDSPGGLYVAPYMERIYAVSGMKEAIEGAGRLNSDYRDSLVEYPEAAEAKSFRCTRFLLDADMIIDFCKLKSHGLMSYTGACKNMFGSIPGTCKVECHYQYPEQRRFADMLVDLCQYLRPAICLADAVVAMEGNGPSNGTPRKLGALLASVSPHALDLCGAFLIGLTADDVPTLAAARDRGLIPGDWRELNVQGSPESFAVSDFKLTPQRDITLWGIKNKGLDALCRKLLAVRPAADKTCTGCGHCAELCPVKAIEIKNRRPKIDRRVCIRCFCCQEFCPPGAMQVERPPLARLLRR